MSEENVGTRFDRLPASEADRVVEGRPTRPELLAWFDERFGIDPPVFDGYTFWERGAGKIWIFEGAVPSPADIEALGMAAVRTRQEFWKPTMEFVQRFGRHANENVVSLSPDQARQFVAGEDQELDWNGDWGYLVVTHELAGRQEPLGVGLFTYGELQSMVPKGRRRNL